MAKQRSANFLEAHVEKIVIGIAALVMAGVLYGLLGSGGVEVGGREVRPSVAAQQSAEQARDIASSLQRPLPEVPVGDYIARAEGFPQPRLLPPTPLDRIPLSPPYLPGGPASREQREYVIPAAPALARAAISVTQDTATIAAAVEGDMGQARTATQQVDVDFITVEASFPYGDLREQFLRNFAGPDVERPLQTAMPLVAAVQLQRARLREDGAWSDYETVPRFDGDGQRLRLPSVEEIENMAQTLYEFELENRQANLGEQQLLIQPMPYPVAGWLPPSLAQLSEEERRDQERRVRTPAQPRPDPRAPTAPGAAPRQPGVQPGMMPGMMGPEFEPGMMPGMAPGQAPGRQEVAPRTTVRRGDMPQIGDWRTVDEVSVWAHDPDAEPGEVYRYRLRVGVFNPIAGRNWATEAQADMADRRILWTDWSEPERWARIPKRTMLFPRQADMASGAASVDVFRKQGGQWYQRAFVVEPGEPIGDVVRMPVGDTRGRRPGDEEAEFVEVDFRTYAALIDILPDQRYWVRRGRQMTRRDTQDMIYRDRQGQVHRVTVDNSLWPADWSPMLAQLRRLIRAR